MGALDDLLARAAGNTAASPAGGDASNSDDAKLDELLAQVTPRPASNAEANSSVMPAEGGKVTELAPTKIEGAAPEQPWYAGLLDRYNRLVAPSDADQHAQLQDASAAFQRAGESPPAVRAALASHVMGGVPAALVPEAAVAGPAQSAGRLLLSAAPSAAAWGGQSALDSLASNPAGGVRAAGMQAVRTGVPMMLMGAGGLMIGRGLQGMSGDVGAVADEARIRAATGMPGGDLEAMGPQARAALASNIEQANMQNAPGMGAILPQPTRTYVRNAADTSAAGLAGMHAGEDAVNALPQPPAVDVGNVINAQRNEAIRLRGLADAANLPQARFREGLANNLEADAASAGPNGELPWARALEQRRNLDQNTNWNRGGPIVGTAAANDATRKEVAGGLRGSIDDALNSPRVPPDVAAGWRTGRDQYALGQSVAEPGLRAMNAGGTSGAIPLSAKAAVLSALTGGSRGQSLLAGSARNGQAVLGGAANLANVGGVGAMIYGAGAAANPAPSPPQPVQQQQEQREALSSALSQGSQGNLLGAKAEQALQMNPQILGPYAQQFQVASQQGPDAVNALVVKLNSDPQWRNGPMVALNRMGSENQ
jgi:hypothetical protein